MRLIKTRLKKIISVLAAFYILVLLSFPCVDDFLTFNPDSRPVVSSVTLPLHQTNHDCCSPFCTCVCCSVAFEVLKTSFISQDAFLPEILTFYFDSRFQSRHDFTIWEPPKA